MESRLRHLLSAEGVKEYTIKVGNRIVGRADACTLTHVIEIKSIKDWKHSIGQLLVYAFCTGKKPRLILIGDRDDLIVDICNRYHIEVQFIPPSDISEASSDWKYLLTCDQLKKLCEKKKLKCGNKGEMIMRLSSLDENESPVCTLDDLTCEMLRTLLKAQSIPCSSLKRSELLSTVQSLWLDR